MKRSLLFLLVLHAACTTTKPTADKEGIAPEISVGEREVEVVSAHRHMVAAGHPLAAEAGLAMLKKGGSAMDAAAAVQFALTVVEPQSSGIGGGAFLLFHDAAQQKATAFDGREMAPLAMPKEAFLDEAAQPLPYLDALVGGRSVGTPGVVAMLALAHQKHGKLPWATLLAPAISLAENGFPLGERLAKQLAEDPQFRTMPGIKGLYYEKDGTPLAAGTLIKNQALAKTLRLLQVGPEAFYKGALAADIVSAVHNAANPGTLTLDDMAGYVAKERAPLCRPYRDHEVCGMPPPTSGGITTLQILGVLERFDLAHMAEGDFAHVLVEAERLAFADRGKYIADSDFVSVPVKGMLDRNYLAASSALIDSEKRSDVKPGLPNGALARTVDRSPELPSTSHLVIVDDSGNVVTMTTSIEYAFGSRILVGGFLLNNQLTDFSFLAEKDGVLVANRIDGKKRPRSSMSPTLVYRGGKPRFALGSPGGSRIIPYVAKTIISLVDFGLDPQAAVAMPHVLCRGGAVEIEPKLSHLAAGLKARGHEVKVAPQISGLQAIEIKDGLLLGGADPRRDGAAVGE